MATKPPTSNPCHEQKKHNMDVQFVTGRPGRKSRGCNLQVARRPSGAAGIRWGWWCRSAQRLRPCDGKLVHEEKVTFSGQWTNKMVQVDCWMKKNDVWTIKKPLKSNWESSATRWPWPNVHCRAYEVYPAMVMALNLSQVMNPFPLLLNPPQILKTRVHLQFWKICGWPIWLLIDPL